MPVTHTAPAHAMTHYTTSIHLSAPSKPPRSKKRHRSFAAPAQPRTRPLDPLWLPVAALVCGLLSAAALFGPAPWSGLQALAAGPLIVAAIALGCIALSRQERGQVLAFTGVAMGAVGLMGATAQHLF